MKCHDAQRLFGAYWDDETSQVERECIEAHFAACPGCRHDYEVLARTLDEVAKLPRHEAAPDLLENTLLSARRATAERDVTPEHRVSWMPAAAVAALLAVGAAAFMQWTVLHRLPVAGSLASSSTSVVVAPVSIRTASGSAAVFPVTSSGALAAAPDSIFDHADDIEFVLDPVALKRGRATVTRELPGGIRTEQAVVSF